MLCSINSFLSHKNITDQYIFYVLVLRAGEVGVGEFPEHSQERRDLGLVHAPSQVFGACL